MQKKHIILAAAAVVMSATLLFSCSRGFATMVNSTFDDVATDRTSGIVGDIDGKFSNGSHRNSNSIDVRESIADISDEESLENQETNDRKLVRTVSLDIKLSDSDQLAKVMTNTVVLAGKYNGYISHQSQESGYHSGASMTARIPKDKTDAFLSELKSWDSVQISNYSDDLEDVTTQYTDTDSRLQSAKAAKERYMNMLEKAETVADVLQIQERLDDIIADEESYQRQLTAMDSQIEYTTIQIDYDCIINKAKQGAVSKTSQSLLALVDEAFGAFLQAFTWFIICIIWLLFILPIMFLVVRVFLFATGKQGKYKKKNEKMEEKLKQSETNEDDDRKS